MKNLVNSFFHFFGYFVLLLLLNYYYFSRNITTFYDISMIDHFYKFNVTLIPVKEGYYPRSHALLNTPQFSYRKQMITFYQTDYKWSKQRVDFSIVLATYERAKCFQRVFKHLIDNRPNNTEIVISDDASRSSEKKSLLNRIATEFKEEDVYVISHNVSFGAFHTKLDGFLFSEGAFIMSIDDDDYFDDQYFIEMAEETIKILSNNTEANFVIALKFPYIERWVKLPYQIDQMIRGFHNHVDFAFRRDLMAGVDYPEQRITIVRDDAPLMIPLYMQTNNSQVFYYHNRYKYLVDRVCRTGHQSNSYYRKRKEYLNGYQFLSSYVRQVNRTEFEPLIKKTYGM